MMYGRFLLYNDGSFVVVVVMTGAWIALARRLIAVAAAAAGFADGALHSAGHFGIGADATYSGAVHHGQAMGQVVLVVGRRGG